MEKWVTKIATNDAMPSGSMSLIEFLLYMLGYIFFYIVLLKCLIKNPEKNHSTNLYCLLVNEDQMNKTQKWNRIENHENRVKMED